MCSPESAWASFDLRVHRVEAGLRVRICGRVAVIVGRCRPCLRGLAGVPVLACRAARSHEAAGRTDVLPGESARIVAGEEGHDIRDVGGFPEAAEWRLLHHVVDRWLRENEAVRPGQAG